MKLINSLEFSFSILNKNTAQILFSLFPSIIAPKEVIIPFFFNCSILYLQPSGVNLIFLESSTKDISGFWFNSLIISLSCFSNLNIFSLLFSKIFLACSFLFILILSNLFPNKFVTIFF